MTENYSHDEHAVALALCGVLVVIHFFAALGDFRHHPLAVQALSRFAFRKDLEIWLGAAMTLAIIGLLVGRGGGPITEVTATGLIGYFTTALYFHKTIKDEFPLVLPAIGMLALSVTLAVVA